MSVEQAPVDTPVRADTPFQVIDGNVYTAWSELAPFTGLDGIHHPDYRNGLIALVYDKDIAPVLAAAPTLLAALEHWVMAVDLLATDSYCEVCHVHAPKDDDGRVIGPIVHYACPFDQARAAIARAKGRS